MPLCSSIWSRQATNLWRLRGRQAFSDLLSCSTFWRIVVLSILSGRFGSGWCWQTELVQVFACLRKTLCSTLRCRMSCQLTNDPWQPIDKQPSTSHIVLRYHNGSRPRCWFHALALAALQAWCGTFLEPSWLLASLRNHGGWSRRRARHCFDFLRDSYTNTNAGPCRWTSSACTLSMWTSSAWNE